MGGLAPHNDDPHEMANLHPRRTGLPMTVWVRPRGDHTSPDGTAVVAIPPEPGLVEGDLAAADPAAEARWIALHRDLRIASWDGTADTTALIARLVRL